MCTSCQDLLTVLDTADPRNNLVATWKCDEQGSYKKSAAEIYRVDIEKHPGDSSRVLIYNFYNIDAVAEAVLNGRILTLPEQNLEGGYKVSGRGEIQADWDEITWSYAVDDGSGQSNEVTAVYTKM